MARAYTFDRDQVELDDIELEELAGFGVCVTDARTEDRYGEISLDDFEA